jgi:ectoine hydroxylase-related dioxygenase (phytanoyl-CoA dioxygenase family)
MRDARFHSNGASPELEKYRRNGFLVIDDFLDPELVLRIRDEWTDFHREARDSLMTKEEPLVVFWRHVVGERKKFRPIGEFPAIKELVFLKKLATLVREFAGDDDIRLLETIIFSKPPQLSNQLNWHQDVAYFPFEPNNQLAVWLPLEPVTRESGALTYVVGTHKQGLMGSVDLHSGQPFKNEDRPIIPTDPEAAGYETYCCEMKPGDIIIHHGMTWHRSGPNVTADHERRGLSVRYLAGTTRYRPRAGSAASFISQVEVQPGDVIEGPSFPRVL